MRESLDSRGIIEDKDEVGKLEANLTTESGASGCDGGRSGPGAVGEAGNDETRAETCRAEEAGFNDSEDGKSLLGRTVIGTYTSSWLFRPRMGVVSLTFADSRTDGGMTLSGPKACRGSMKEARIFPHFLHSARRRVTFRQSVSFQLLPGGQWLGWGRHLTVSLT